MITRDQFPENLRSSFDEMEKLFNGKEARLDDDFMNAVTWAFWARRQTNLELCNVVRDVLKYFEPLGRTPFTISLYEVIKRLKIRPRHQRLFPEERIRKKGKK